MIRVAAVGDLHVNARSRGTLRPHFLALSGKADVLLLAGDLTHLGSRLTLGAGILPNHRGTLVGWIGDSQSIKPGNRMPSYDRLSAGQLNAIAAWLEQQR